MLKKILITISIIVAGALAVLPILPASPAYAANKFNEKICGLNGDSADKAAAGCDDDQKITNIAVNIVQVAIGIAGFLAVGAIIISGQRLIVSDGDAQKINSAKKMLTYAIVGLVVAVLAFAITNFVSGAITSDTNTGGAGTSNGGSGGSGGDAGDKKDDGKDSKDDGKDAKDSATDSKSDSADSTSSTSGTK